MNCVQIAKPVHEQDAATDSCYKSWVLLAMQATTCVLNNYGQAHRQAA
jgi:hypothetical protein